MLISHHVNGRGVLREGAGTSFESDPVHAQPVKHARSVRQNLRYTLQLMEYRISEMSGSGAVVGRGRAISGAAWRILCFIFIGGISTAQEAPPLSSHLFEPYIGAVVENSSNLFAVPPQLAVDDPHGVPRSSDTVSTYRGGSNFNYMFDLQRLYGTFEARRLEYDRFTNLNHSEYLIDLGLAWKLTSRFDGLVDFHREKKIIAFGDADVTQLEIQTDQVVRGTFNVAVMPEWRLETQASLHTLDYPIAQSPDYRLREGLERIGVKYVGVANLAYGIEGIHIDGNYQGVVGAADYKQNTAQLAMTYKIKNVTHLSAAVGYTDRSIEGSPTSVSGVTGEFGYDRQITGKTRIYAQVQRLINSYYTAGSSEIDTSVTVGANWQATPKLGATIYYEYVRSTFEGATLQDSLTLGRKDSASYSGFEIKYQALRWLSVRPYIKRQVRTSSIPQLTYNDTLLGVELLVKRNQ